MYSIKNPHDFHHEEIDKDSPPVLFFLFYGSCLSRQRVRHPVFIVLNKI